jgi:uncharacterized membrane protein
MLEPDYLNEAQTEAHINLKVTHVIYGLQLVGLFTFVGFVFGIILNYIKLSDVRGTWLSSHFSWQIRTFWYGVLWSIIGSALIIIMVGYVILGINFIWLIYRVVRGWMNLIDHRAMY